MLAYGVHDLQEAGILPGLNNLAFDVSDTITPTTWYGTLLKGIFNFSPATTVAGGRRLGRLRRPVMTLFLLSGRRRTPPRTPGRRRARPPSHPRPTDHPTRRTDTPMRTTTAMALILAVPLLGACTENASSDGGAADPRTVSTSTSTDDGCDALRHRGAGRHAHLRRDQRGHAGHRVLPARRRRPAHRRRGRERRPQLTRELVVNAAAGDYLTACKPGMNGEGIRARLHRHRLRRRPRAVGDRPGLVDAALANYAAYVQDQSDQLVTETQEFVDAYTAGDDDEARALYPEARVHWERIETVAESFGDLDPKMDAREADLEPGQEWTGWHRIEKDLWPAGERYAAAHRRASGPRSPTT